MNIAKRLRQLSTPLMVSTAALVAGGCNKETISDRQLSRDIELVEKKKNETLESFKQRLHQAVREKGIKDPEEFLKRIQLTIKEDDDQTNSYDSMNEIAFNFIYEETILNNALEKKEISQNFYEYLSAKYLGSSEKLFPQILKSFGKEKDELVKAAIEEALIPEDLKEYFDSKVWYKREIRNKGDGFTLDLLFNRLRDLKTLKIDLTNEMIKQIVQYPDWSLIVEALDVLKRGFISVEDLNSILAKEFVPQSYFSKQADFYKEFLLPLAFENAQKNNRINPARLKEIKERLDIQTDIIRLGSNQPNIDKYLLIYKEALDKLNQ